jgi:phosphoglycolate phosphatase
MLKITHPIPGEHIKLLIFDLDGTLIDSRLDLANSVNATLHHYGRPELPLDVIAGYIGDGAPMLIRRALGDPDDEAFVQQAQQAGALGYLVKPLDVSRIVPSLETALARARDLDDLCGDELFLALAQAAQMSVLVASCAIALVLPSPVLIWRANGLGTSGLGTSDYAHSLRCR